MTAAMLTDSDWVLRIIFGSLLIWALISIAASLISAAGIRYGLRTPPPTLADHLNAARSEPVDAETLAREWGLR